MMIRPYKILLLFTAPEICDIVFAARIIFGQQEKLCFYFSVLDAFSTQSSRFLKD